MQQFTVNTSNRQQLLDITRDVQDCVNESGVTDGLACIFVPHTTAAVTINENADSDVVHDILYTMKKHFPPEQAYRHGEGNSDSHVQSSLVGPSLTVIVENGRLCLGTWQGIYFAEFDGPRRRKCWVKVVG